MGSATNPRTASSTYGLAGAGSDSDGDGLGPGDSRQSHVEQKEDRLRSTPGVGPVSATTLLADLPELVMLNQKQIAALVDGLGWPSPRQGHVIY